MTEETLKNIECYLKDIEAGISIIAISFGVGVGVFILMSFYLIIYNII